VVYQTDAVEAGAVGLDGPCSQTRVQATREASGLCHPPCTIPHLREDQTGAVLRQGREVAKAESQEMLQVGISLPAEVAPAIRDLSGSCRKGQTEPCHVSFGDQKAKLKING